MDHSVHLAILAVALGTGHNKSQKLTARPTNKT